MVEYKNSQIPDETLDRTLAALADPTRRAILNTLTTGEQRVSDLAEPFDMSLNAVSKHIKTLEQAGLVERRRAGRTHYLKANPLPIEQAADWFDQQRQFWKSRLDKLESLINMEANNE